MTWSGRRALLALVLAWVTVAAGAAQRGQTINPLPPQPRPQPGQAQTLPQFRSQVDLVHLDVSVLDRNRRPVQGLGPNDFTILENGQPQKLAVFNAVNIPVAVPPKTAWLRDVAPDVRNNEDLRERRIFLILIDDAAIQAVPLAMQNVKKVAKDFIDRLGPSDLAAVVFTRDNRNSQDFTRDRARLLAAVDKFTVGFRDMGDPSLYFRYSVDVVRRTVETLAKLPDRRKAIVYVGQGVPVDLAMAAAPASLGITDGAFSAVSQRGEMGQLRHLMEQTFLAASRANVSVYTIDVCGLRVEGQRAGFGPVCVPGLEVDYLINVATVTGGHAVVNTNEFGPGIDAIIEENSSYYLLGYQSGDTRQDGKYRRIEVTVNRPDLMVRTRTGYLAEKAESAAKRKAQLEAEPIGAALAGVLPKGDLPMRLTAVPFAVPGKKEAAVAVMLSVRQPIRETGTRTIERVDMVVGAYNTDGKYQGGTRLRADVTVRAGASGLAEYEVLARLDLKPGRYQLRTAANVGALATSGSLYYDLDVPDFSDDGVSLSGLVLRVNPAMPIAPIDGLKGVIPIIPTTQRTFRSTDEASAFVRVYQGGQKPLVRVPFRIQLRNDENLTVLDRQDTVEAPSFGAGRAADVNVALPISRLRPGEYLLSIEATVPQKPGVVKREVRFSIQ
ncbi:MAG TPA: VWA domain-containing protein [Vicinamibacterales bacterium]|nr:VWA domain-containing protein [Vicinamibacterales bacterium]